ncbi:MAG: metallophosphoesterase [Sphingomonadaceae bacterium]|nr:metallophosphoesterase [Sphingomonadaceae bacterium]
MLIAQVTDLHIGFDPDNPAEFNRRRLDQVLHRIIELHPRPELLLATGDLTDKGDSDSYRRLRVALEACSFPVLPCVGNHDHRGNFARHFPDVPFAGGFVQYTWEKGPLRLILLDTLEEGRHGGAFCAERAAWLAARLAEERDKPTAIVLHHPPVETGIDWMTSNPEAVWIARLRDAMVGADNIVGLIAGHIHRPMTTNWEGRTLAVAPSTAPQVALDLSTIDPDRPDGRPMIIADAPAYALHWWNGAQLVTHFDDADDHVELARFDEGMRPLVRHLIEERLGDG